MIMTKGRKEKLYDIASAQLKTGQTDAKTNKQNRMYISLDRNKVLDSLFYFQYDAVSRSFNAKGKRCIPPINCGIFA